MRLTVGPLPSAVYWRRRALVLGAVLLVLFLVAQACMAASASPDRQSGADEPRPTGTPSPAAAPPTGSPAAVNGAQPEPDGEPEDLEPSGLLDEDDLGPDGCADDELLVVAEATPASLAAGGSARFTLRYVNDSGRVCQRDVGPGRRELFLRPEGATPPVWSSRDCQDLRGRDVQSLTPGIAASHYIDWNGRASDSCDGVEPAGEVLPPGEYELFARLGTVYSEPVTVTVSGAA